MSNWTNEQVALLLIQYARQLDDALQAVQDDLDVDETMSEHWRTVTARACRLVDNKEWTP